MLIEPGPDILPEIGCNRVSDGTLITGKREGLHLSEVIHYYLTAKKGVALGPYGDLDKWALQATEAGWVWERLLAMIAVERQDLWGLIFQEAWKHRRLEVDRLDGKQVMQASLEVDGIRMTPDGLDVTGPAPVLLEDKHTRKSSKWTGYDIVTDEPLTDPKYSGGFSEHFMGWLLQMSGYAHAWSVRLGEPVLTARLRVYWAGGDYSWRPGASSQGKCYIFRFDETELRETWRMLLSLASELQRSKIALVTEDSANSAG